MDIKPMMDDNHIKIIENTFLSLNKKKIDVLEWGSGNSTVYFAEFLEKNKINYSWISLEHDKQWYEKTKNEIIANKIIKNKKNISILFFEIDKNNPKSINLDDYVSYPRESKRKFDIIIIDGRQRARCLIESKFLLKSKGIIFLHDAEREKYHYAFENFKTYKLISSQKSKRLLWMGIK